MTIKLTKSLFSWFCLAAMMVFGLQLNAQSSTMVIGAGAAAGTYDIGHSLFSPNFATLTGTLSTPDDGSGNDQACGMVTNDLTGTIALVDFKATCLAEASAANCVAAGAIGVVICNAVQGGTPNTIRGTGSVDLMVPVVSLDSVSCANIRVAMAADPVTVNITGPAAGETCISAITAAEGMNSGTMSTAGFGGTIFQLGTQATWYEYTAPIDGILTISSCGGGENTRLIGFFVGDCLGVNVALNSNQFFASVDDCDDGIGGMTASEVVFIVDAGQQVRFLWDDAQSTGIDEWTFSVTTEEFPMLDVTLNVDMSQETVDPSGVFVTGNMTGGNAEAMTDNGDGTYSYTFTAQTNDQVTYLFSNGATQENGADLTICGNGTDRVFDVFFDMNVSVPLVCFGSCAACPAPPTPGCDIPDTNIVFCEDFDTYDLGPVGLQSDNFTTWSLNPGGPDDCDVTDVVSSSGDNSIVISDVDPDDAILLLGGRTGGIYQLDFLMYIPPGSSAYWNIQKVTTGFGGANENFNMQSFMMAGQGDIQTEGANVANYSYPEGAWFPIELLFDIEADLTTMTVDGVEAGSWPVSNTITPDSGEDKVVGSIDFFGNTGNLYYVDDIIFREIEAETAEVTFIVDMELETDVMDVFFAGTPNGWSDEAMTLIDGQRYGITKELVVGDTIQYKFKNGANGWEGFSGSCTMGNDNNRFLIVESGDVALDTVCFNACVTCIMVGLDAVALNEGINVYPNPASEAINIAYDFNETIELDVSITNTLGQTVKQLPTNTVDRGMINVNIAELSTGIYFLNFRHNNVLTTKKIIIE